MRLHAHRADASLRNIAVGQLFRGFHAALALKVDRDAALRAI